MLFSDFACRAFLTQLRDVNLEYIAQFDKRLPELAGPFRVRRYSGAEIADFLFGGHDGSRVAES